MDATGSLLLLFIFAIVIFGIPVVMLTIRVIEMTLEWRESIKHAEEETAVEKKAPIEKKPPDDAGEWTPAKHMR